MMRGMVPATTADALGGDQRAVTRLRLRTVDHVEVVVAHTGGLIDNDQLRPAMLTGDADRLPCGERDTANKPLLLEASHIYASLGNDEIIAKPGVRAVRHGNFRILHFLPDAVRYLLQVR